MELQKQNIERLEGIRKSFKNEIPALEKETFQVEIKKTNLQAELRAMRYVPGLEKHFNCLHWRINRTFLVCH